MVKKIIEHIHTHIYTYTHTQTHIYTYIHTYIYTHTDIHTYTHMHTQESDFKMLANRIAQKISILKEVCFMFFFVNVHPFRVQIDRETSLKNTFNHYHKQAPRSQSCKLILNAINVKTGLDTFMIFELSFCPYPKIQI